MDLSQQPVICSAIKRLFQNAQSLFRVLQCVVLACSPTDYGSNQVRNIFHQQLHDFLKKASWADIATIIENAFDRSYLFSGLAILEKSNNYDSVFILLTESLQSEVHLFESLVYHLEFALLVSTVDPNRSHRYKKKGEIVTYKTVGRVATLS